MEQTFKLMEIIQNNPTVRHIMLRTNYPEDYEKECPEATKDGILYAYGEWDGEKFISVDEDFLSSVNLDFDSYLIDENNQLIVWFTSEWM